MAYEIKMNNIYSYSRIETFRQCPLKYKFNYIDGIKRKTQSIEAFMGSRFHEAMELLYKDIRFKSPSVNELIEHYNNQWDEKYSDNVFIVKKERTRDDYRRIGIEAINDYYKRYYPFDQSRVLGIERAFVFSLDDKDEHRLKAIIDRISQAQDSSYEIHDYKTSSSLPDQQQVDKDIQLALYQIALEKMWQDVKKVKLIWHFVAHDKELISTRTKDELEAVRNQTIKLIDEIVAAKDFPAKESALCRWCSYQEICPQRKHLLRAGGLPENEYKNDEGVVLVSKYALFASEKERLKKEIEDIEKEQDKIKEAAIKFAEREGVSLIDGPTARLKIEQKQELRPPSKTENSRKWEGLRTFLIQEGKYEEVSTVNHHMLKFALGKVWPKEFVEQLKIFLIESVTKFVKLVKK